MKVEEARKCVVEHLAAAIAQRLDEIKGGEPMSVLNLAINEDVINRAATHAFDTFHHQHR